MKSRSLIAILILTTPTVYAGEGPPVLRALFATVKRHEDKPSLSEETRRHLTILRQHLVTLEAAAKETPMPADYAKVLEKRNAVLQELSLAPKSKNHAIFLSILKDIQAKAHFAQFGNDAAFISWSQTGVPGIVFSNDGKCVYSASTEGTIRRWDPKQDGATKRWTTNKAIKSLYELSEEANVFGATEVYFFGAAEEGIWMYDAKNNKDYQFGGGGTNADKPKVIGFGKGEIIVADLLGGLQTWDVVGKKMSFERPPSVRPTIASTNGVWSCFASPREGIFVSKDVRKGFTLLTRDSDNITNLSVSKYGDQLVMAEKDGTVAVWNLATQKKSEVLRTDFASIRVITVSGDGKVAVAGVTKARTEEVRAWDLSNGKTLFARVTRSEDHVVALAFASDHRTLAIEQGGGDTRTVSFFGRFFANPWKKIPVRIEAIENNKEARYQAAYQDDDEYTSKGKEHQLPALTSTTENLYAGYYHFWIVRGGKRGDNKPVTIDSSVSKVQITVR